MRERKAKKKQTKTSMRKNGLPHSKMDCKYEISRKCLLAGKFGDYYFPIKIETISVKIKLPMCILPDRQLTVKVIDPVN